MQTTMGGILNLKYDNASPLIKANSDRTGNGEEADAVLIEVERGTDTNKKLIGMRHQTALSLMLCYLRKQISKLVQTITSPKATINATTGNISTDGTITATSSITTASVLNFSTASQGAIVFNSDLGR